MKSIEIIKKNINVDRVVKQLKKKSSGLGSSKTPQRF